MFRFFKKKTKIDILREKYNELLNEARRLSDSSRAESYKKYAEAEEVMELIERLTREEESKG